LEFYGRLAVNPDAIIEQAESSLGIYQKIVFETVNPSFPREF